MRAEHQPRLFPLKYAVNKRLNCRLYRRHLLRERLHWEVLHAEDLDLCRRVRQAGAMVAVANEAEVLHVRGVSSRARPLFVEWHKHRGLWRYFRKFEAARRGRITRLAVFAMIWGRFPLAALRAALRR